MNDEQKINALKARLQGLVFACRDINLSDSVANERYHGRLVNAIQEAERLLSDLNTRSNNQAQTKPTQHI